MPRKKVETLQGTPTKATGTGSDLASTLTPNEQLMKIIYDLYTVKDVGALIDHVTSVVFVFADR